MEFDSLRIGYSSPISQANTAIRNSSEVRKYDINDTVISVQQSNATSKDVSQDIRPVRNREKELNEENIAKAVEEANKQLRGSFREFSYDFHRKTNTVMIKIINSDTKETIREIPPEKALDALAKMWELAGIIVDEKITDFK